MGGSVPAPLGWIGFDPTNSLIAEERHIRVAIGRDYADVPPTRGVYKGVTAVRSELFLAVHVGPVESPMSGEMPPFRAWDVARRRSAPGGAARRAAATVVTVFRPSAALGFPTSALVDVAAVAPIVHRDFQHRRFASPVRDMTLLS